MMQNVMRGMHHQHGYPNCFYGYWPSQQIYGTMLTNYSMVHSMGEVNCAQQAEPTKMLPPRPQSKGERPKDSTEKDEQEAGKVNSKMPA